MSFLRGMFARRTFSAHKTCYRCISSVANKNIVKSDYNVVVPSITLTELSYAKIERFHKYKAVESGSNGRSYTYEQVRIKSRNLSKALRQKFKLKDGDVIAVLLPNIPEYIICFLGSLEARLIVTTVNPAYTADELSKQIIDASAKVIITQAHLVDTVKAALRLAKREFPIINIKETQAESLPEGTIDFSELVDTHIDIPDIQPGNVDDIVALPFSSGTTGLPKAVEIRNRNCVANLTQISHPNFNSFVSASDSYQEVSPGILPFYHIYGMTLNFLSLNYGCKFITLNKFTPESYIAALRDNPITVLYVAPPLVTFMSAHPDVKSEYFKNVKAMTCGAAPLGYLDEERFLRKAGNHVKVSQGYGLTETSPTISLTPNDVVRCEKNAGSVGKLLPNTISKIISPGDPEGKPLGPNEKGEILLKGPQVMKGYYNRPEETKNAFLDGWLRTGDIGYYDENKFLFITDRLKELIKVRGFQVAPAELEEVIRNHPAIADVGVIGIPDPINGEVPRAYIVPKKDTTVNIEELQEYVANKVAKYKKLVGGIKVVDAIPKNPSGKILRRKLKTDYIDKGI